MLLIQCTLLVTILTNLESVQESSIFDKRFIHISKKLNYLRDREQIFFRSIHFQFHRKFGKKLISWA